MFSIGVVKRGAIGYTAIVGLVFLEGFYEYKGFHDYGVRVFSSLPSV